MTGRIVILALMAGLIVEVLFCRWLARKKWRRATTRVTVAAGIASVVGPACAILPYMDSLPLFLRDLAGVWVLAGIGVIGIGIGVFALSGRSKIAGMICILTNIPVVAYWGFIAVFVSMGGGS